MSDEIQKALNTLNVGKKTTNDVVSNISQVVIEGRTVSVMNDTFNKGALFSNINDVVADFLAEKTGKEIKEKIAVIRQYDDNAAQAYLSAANGYLPKCPCKPTDTTMVDDWELRGTKMKFGVIPAMFTWDEVYAVDEANRKVEQTAKESVQYSMDSMQKKEAPVKLENACRLYNQNIRQYVSARVESLILQTVENNMDEKKKYKLTAEQASKLGF